jgi:hypothetical protein
MDDLEARVAELEVRLERMDTILYSFGTYLSGRGGPVTCPPLCGREQGPLDPQTLDQILYTFARAMYGPYIPTGADPAFDPPCPPLCARPSNPPASAV